MKMYIEEERQLEDAICAVYDVILRVEMYIEKSYYLEDALRAVSNKISREEEALA